MALAQKQDSSEGMEFLEAALAAPVAGFPLGVRMTMKLRRTR